MVVSFVAIKHLQMRLVFVIVSAILITVTPTLVSGQYYEKFGAWEVTEPLVNFPPGARSDALIAQRQMDADDINLTEYSPRLVVMCNRGAVGPYERPRIKYNSLNVSLTWIASSLPKDFDAVKAIIPGQGPIGGNAIWISNGRAPDALIKIGEERVIETIKVNLAPLRESQRYRFSAEILDSNAAEAFLRAWSPKDRLTVYILDARGNELERAVDLRDMRSPVNKVLAHCERSPLSE